MAGRTIEEMTEEFLAMPLPEKKTGVFGRIANALSWFNEPFDFPPTMGNVFRKLTFQDIKEDKASRLGRLTERAFFVVLGLAALALTPGGIGPIIMFGVAKFAAITAGEIVQPVGRFAEGFFRMMDRKFGPKPPELAGTSKSGEDPVGARQDMKRGNDMGHSPGMDQEPAENPVGARKFAAMSIREQFSDNAADQRDRQPSRPAAPVQIFRLDGNKM